MKTKLEILILMEKLVYQKADLEDKYRKLNQIDMLSREGNQLKKDINPLQGYINALNWVIK